MYEYIYIYMNRGPVMYVDMFPLLCMCPLSEVMTSTLPCFGVLLRAIVEL